MDSNETVRAAADYLDGLYFSNEDRRDAVRALIDYARETLPPVPSKQLETRYRVSAYGDLDIGKMDDVGGLTRLDVARDLAETFFDDAECSSVLIERYRV